MVFDLIIENGLVIDGTGKAAYPAAVGITDEKISAIGDLSDSESQEKIDATGHVITPGFKNLYLEKILLKNQILINPIC